MASPQIQNPPTVEVAESSLPPMSIPLLELSDARYFAEVLLLRGDESEGQLDRDVEAKATKLGLSKYPPGDKRNTSSAQSAVSTVPTYHARTFSTGSDDSFSTAPTTNSALFGPPSPQLGPSDSVGKRRPKSLSFSQYDRYLTKVSPNLDQPKIQRSAAPPDTTAKSLFSVKTTRSLFSIKSGFKKRIKWRKTVHPSNPPVSCICCRDDFNKSSSLQTLPCGHTYCADCLKVMVNQATTDESKMPPRCCTQPIPGPIVKSLLDRESQQLFLKSVIQFSTPWESRIFCPNTSCGEFIPPRHKIDPKHPFAVTCRKCRTRACVMCKRNAHPVGKDCPEDWELEAVLKMGEKSGWRRCYKCRNLVELTQGCTHMTCRCKAQFCYICGGVWDASVGCPNVCNGEEELERRRLEEEEREAELEAEKIAQEAAAAAETAERAEAEERTRHQPALQDLRKQQEAEKQRFLAFTAKGKVAIRIRHDEAKARLADKHRDQEEKMLDRHTKTASHLDDRQIAAEMELRATLEQSERSVKIRLKHMERYCDGLGRNPSTVMPPRVVTERDLRELGQQYNLRDGMERMKQAKINVMRDRQTQQMEELLERHEAELEKMGDKRQEDLEDLAAQFAHEEDAMNDAFNARREKLEKRWWLATAILCKELQDSDGKRYAPITPPEWPTPPPSAEPEPEPSSYPSPPLPSNPTEDITMEESKA